MNFSGNTSSDAPVVDSVDAYVTRARELAADAGRRGVLEAAVCRADGNLFNDDESVAEWAAFLRRASSGAAPAPFSNTGSTTVSGISLAAASTPAAQKEWKRWSTCQETRKRLTLAASKTAVSLGKEYSNSSLWRRQLIQSVTERGTGWSRRPQAQSP